MSFYFAAEVESHSLIPTLKNNQMTREGEKARLGP
jgi:hypothetical protein